MCYKFFFFVCFCVLSTHLFCDQPQAIKTELTAEDVGAFLDGFLPLQIEQADIAGAVVGVVKDGKLLFAKGYGFADKENKLPVSPETTLFRPGSISKLFTWTAVMQQVERGKLELDRDINDYLDFKIPETFEKPITLRDVMTHRTGFEESIKDLFVGSVGELRSLSHYVKTHLPTRIFPAGEVPAYSNYATNVAAYLVERVSGQTFDEYVEEHILKPLHMETATFRQPLPEHLSKMMSKGYLLGSGDSMPFELVQGAPSGALSITAESMSHFMLMHLNEGRYGTAEILNSETAHQMHARQKGWPEAMNAMCLGFYEQSQNGYRVIGHDGDTIQFHSSLFLLIDEKIGLFVSYNSLGQSKANLRNILFSHFMDRYFPERSPSTEFLSSSSEISNIIGSYEPSRRCENTFLSISTLTREVNVDDSRQENAITLKGFNEVSSKPIKLQKIAPDLYKEIDGKAKIAFTSDKGGKQTIYVDYPFMVFQEISQTYNKQSFNYSLIVFCFSVMMLSLFAWPITFLTRRHYNKPLRMNMSNRIFRTLSYLVCFLAALFIAGLLIFASRLTDFSTLSERSDLYIRLLQIVGWGVGIGSLFAIVNCYNYWTDNQKGIWAKIWSTLLAVSCVGFFWFIYHWNLLKFDLNY